MTTEPPRTRHTAIAVAALFAVNGATFSNWLPRLPEIRDELGIGNAGLGATLLGGGLGGVLGSIVVGRVMDRFGSRLVVMTAASALSIGLPLIGVAPTAVALAALLTLLGALDVCNDVAMNAQGVFVQEAVGRSIMNRLHAMWSLGFTVGALIGSGAAAAGLGVRPHLVIVGAVLLVTVLVVQRWLLRIDPEPVEVPIESSADDTVSDAPAARSRRVSPTVIAMALAALGAALLEITPHDWASVVMRDEFDAERLAGFGTVAVAGAMLIGRLGGDHVLDRIGGARLLNGALVVSGIGALVTITAPTGAVAIVGFALWGLGVSVVFPQLYADAARLPGTSAGTGLGSMLLGQRTGGLSAAVVIGSLAEWQGLRVALGVVAATALATMAVSLRLTRAAAA